LSDDGVESGPATKQMDQRNQVAEVAALEEESRTAARLFDIRRVIGWLFVFYGLLIGTAGVFADDATMGKAQGVNINLWTGLAVLVVGLLFLLWVRLRPLALPRPRADSTDGET
jgi:hypothetical protein